MNFRLTAILFGVILVLGLVLLGITYFDDSSTSTEVLMEELATAGIKSDQVDVVEIDRPDLKSTLKIARTGPDKWEIQEPMRAPADPSAVEGVISALLKAKPTFYGELHSNPGVHGLEPPSLRVTLRKGDKSSTVNVGEVTVGGQQAVAFVTTSARSRKPMAVPASSLAALFRDPNASGKAGDLAKWTSDFRTKTIFPDTRGEANVTALSLISKGKNLALTHGTKDDWTFDSPPGWGAADLAGDANPTAIGFTGVRSLITALTSLQATANDDFIENPKDLKEYGLNPDNPDLIRAELKTKDSKSVVFIGKKIDVSAPPPHPGMPPTPSTKWFVRIEGVPGVIRANANKLEGLASIINDPDPLRDRTLLPFDKTRVDAIDLVVGGQTIKLRKAVGSGVPQWKLYGGPNDPSVASMKLVDDILNVLGERRTIRDFPPKNDANFAGPELKVEVKLWADSIDPAANKDPKAEPKLKGEPLTLQIGKHEGDRFFVRRTLSTGEKNDFTMPERVPIAGTVPVSIELLPTIRKDRLALLDPSLNSFSPFLTSKVTVTNGPNVYELEHADSTDPAFASGKWTYAKPDAKKGQIAEADAVQVELLGTLNRLTASRYIAETPTEQQLAGWGLDAKSPRVKVVVGLKSNDADKERVYYFGNDVGDGSVYARQEGRAAVFAVPKAVFDKITTVDLRDRAVTRFDKSKVKGLRIRGWKEAGPAMVTMELEKTAGEWKVKSPAGTTVNGTKVESLLGVLDGLKAKTYVLGNYKPEHRFSPENESGFEVTVILDGAPAITLNIGGETPDKTAYFGFCSALPPNEQIFTTAAEPLRPFKASPNSLK